MAEIEIELSAELADELTRPMIEHIDNAPDDELAHAVIRLLHTVAGEERQELRKMFVEDVALKIYARTLSARDAALSFAAC